MTTIGYIGIGSFNNKTLTRTSGPTDDQDILGPIAITSIRERAKALIYRYGGPTVCRM